MSVTARSVFRLPLRISSLIRHHRVCTILSQPCLNSLRLSHDSLFQQSCSYTSRWSGFADPGAIGQYRSDDPEYTELVDDDEEGNFISLDESDTPDSLKAELQREDMIFRQKLKRKIIEKKYFRPPKELNLLTWQAKAQIRHLHRIAEDKWTPQHLAYHFPVSEDGVKHILQNRYDPDSERAIEKHDIRVKKTWKRLKELSFIQLTANLIGEDEELWNGTVDRLTATRVANASGILHLPMPKQPNFELTPEKSHGPFGSLIKNHREQLKLIDGPDSGTAAKIDLDDIHADNVIHLKRLLRGLAKNGLIEISPDLLRDKGKDYVQPRHNHTHKHNDKSSDSVNTKRPSVPGPAPVAFRYLPPPSLGEHRFNEERTWPGHERFIDRYKQNRDLANNYQSDSAVDQHNIKLHRNKKYPDKYVNNHGDSNLNVSRHKKPSEVESHQNKYYTETVFDEDGNLLYRVPGMPG